jgi:hypothetical protein
MIGGGLYVESGQARIIENRISSNTATLAGGGLALVDNQSSLRSNSIAQNRAAIGGGVYLAGDDGTLANNIIVENRAEEAGSGLAIRASSPHLVHTTLARNRGGDGSGVAVLPSSLDRPSSMAMTNTILVSHTVALSVASGSTVTLEATVWGTGTWANATDWIGAGIIVTGQVNIWDRPVFARPDDGDYHLSAGSAGVDDGVNAGEYADIDGQGRPHESGFDMGADEFYQVLTTHLPLVTHNFSKTVSIPNLLILDKDGVAKDWDWLVATFGAVEIVRAAPGPAYRVCTLQEEHVQVTIKVRAAESETPLSGITVIRYWPDAPFLPPEMVDWHDRGVHVPTNEAGLVEFAMGMGDKYFPPSAGASDIWVSDSAYPSDLMKGLGMLDGTDHIHLNVEFCLVR